MDETLERKTVDLLIKNKMHIAFAESCTGGLACGRLINVPDASKVIDASIVTYANDAKVKYLGVKTQAIEKFGVVSELVAGQMAEGVARENSAQVGVGISGIAGPTGGSIEKPVGTVCFGFFINGKTVTSTMHFGDLGRNTVREKAVEYVFVSLNSLLEKI